MLGVNQNPMSENRSFFDKRKQLSIYWYNKASDLRGSAAALWASMDEKRSNEIVNELHLGAGFSLKIATYPVYRMLCGMALELLYKAIIVAKQQEPQEIHELVKLSEQAGIDMNDKEKGLLRILSESIIWDGRYPVPKKAEHMQYLYELITEYLYDKVPDGKLHVLRSNQALSWESFNELWGIAFEVYWKHHS